MIVALEDWAITTSAIVALVLVGVIVFSILRPSARVKIGVFFERELEHLERKREPDEPPADDDAPTMHG